jgi:hypothetical protein
VALAAVDELEALTDGLSRSLWQKMMILSLSQGTNSGDTDA